MRRLPPATRCPVRGPNLGAHHPAAHRGRPARHRRPSLIPGAHQVSRKSDGTDYGRGGKGVDERARGFLRRRAESRGWVGRWGGSIHIWQGRRCPSPACRHPTGRVPAACAATRRSLAFHRATGTMNSLREPTAHPRKQGEGGRRRQCASYLPLDGGGRREATGGGGLFHPTPSYLLRFAS